MQKKKIPKYLLTLLTISLLFIILEIGVQHAYANSCGGIETAIISCNENENGIGHILKLIIEILSIGAGIFAAIGVSIFGLQYLKAGGNEEKTRKAKRRMIEIVIGLVLFVLMGSIMHFLIPDGTTNPDDIPAFTPPDYSGGSGNGGSNPSGNGGSNPSGNGGSNPSGNGGSNPSGNGGSNPSGNGGSNPSGNGGSGQGSSKIAERINETAHKFAWPIGDKHNYFTYSATERTNPEIKKLIKTPNSSYFAALEKYTMVGENPITQANFDDTSDDNGFWRQGASCDVFVGMVVRDVTQNMDFPFRSPRLQMNYAKDHSELFKFIGNSPNAADLQPGDLMFIDTETNHHSKIYCGSTSGYTSTTCQASYKGYTAAVSTGVITNGYTVYRYIGDR